MAKIDTLIGEFEQLAQMNGWKGGAYRDAAKMLRRAPSESDVRYLTTQVVQYIMVIRITVIWDAVGLHCEKNAEDRSFFRESLAILIPTLRAICEAFPDMLFVRCALHQQHEQSYRADVCEGGERYSPRELRKLSQHPEMLATPIIKINHWKQNALF